MYKTDMGITWPALSHHGWPTTTIAKLFVLRKAMFLFSFSFHIPCYLIGNGHLIICHNVSHTIQLLKLFSLMRMPDTPLFNITTEVLYSVFYDQ